MRRTFRPAHDRRRTRPGGRAAGLIVFLVWLTIGAGAAAAAEVRIFAAASLGRVLTQILAPQDLATRDLTSQDPGLPKVQLHLAASPVLARQIVSGARADLFFSAHRDWVDVVGRRQATGPAFEWAGNRMVLASLAHGWPNPPESPGSPSTADPDRALAWLRQLRPPGRLILTDPDLAPAGVHAQQVLDFAGVTQGFQRIHGKDAAASLNLLIRGEAPLALLYRSDVAFDPGRFRWLEIPPPAHAPIRYLLVQLAPGEASPEIRAVRARLDSARARTILHRAGFLVPGVDFTPQPAGAPPR